MAKLCDVLQARLIEQRKFFWEETKLSPLRIEAHLP
jgi:hypothetical protein